MLDVRWSLIKSGIEKENIKIRNCSLFVNNSLLGKVDNSNCFKYEDGVQEPQSKTQTNSSVSVSSESVPSEGALGEESLRETKGASIASNGPLGTNLIGDTGINSNGSVTRASQSD